MNRSLAHKSWLAFAALAVLLAACSSGAPRVPPPASQVPVATSAAAATDVCALMPAAQVAQITGLTIGAAANRVIGVHGPTDNGCVYGDNDAVIDVISPGGGAYYNDLANQYYAGNYTQITGYGDKAFQDLTDGSGFVALFGDTAYDVYLDNPNDQLTDAQVNQASESIITALRAKP